MPSVQAGEVKLNYYEQGRGDNVVVFIHGNLGCIDWMDLVWPLVPPDIHAFAIDWRGCGESEKPAPDSEYRNYSMEQHADDMILALKALGIGRCHLANHSTGGIICFHMLLEQPDMFGRVLCLDPVGPMGLNLKDNLDLFRSMRHDRALTYNVMATAAPSLFTPESLEPGGVPEFRDSVTQEQRRLYERIIDKTQTLSEGIWVGTALDLTRKYESGQGRARMGQVSHEHLILWGENDLWIPRADMQEMASQMPRCQLRELPGVGHSCNLEDPERYAAIFCEHFS